MGWIYGIKSNHGWMGCDDYDYSGEWAYSLHASHNAPTILWGRKRSRFKQFQSYLTVDLKGITIFGWPRSISYPVTGKFIQQLSQVPANDSLWLVILWS